MMVMCIGFGAETLFLDDWSPTRWFTIAGVCATILICGNLPTRERQKWKEAHRLVFGVFKDAYLDRAGWIFTAYIVGAILFALLVVHPLLVWLIL